LDSCRVEDEKGLKVTFPIDEFTRHCLLEGLDDIGLTLEHKAEIAKYDAAHPVPAAWRV
jgi:3-isopropylmalate/(R)-2-methylmalate dehydratase small subunit